MATVIRRLIAPLLHSSGKRLNHPNAISVSQLSGSSVFQSNTEPVSQHEGEEEVKKDDTTRYDTLYPGHITTSFFQKSLLAVGSGISVFLNPARADMLCSLAETTGVPALRSIKKKMEADTSGRQILEERPVLTSETLNMDYLGSLPDGTLGKEHWRFLQENGFSPDDRLPVNFIDDADLMYVMLRYRQCHDIIHSMLGMPPNMLGEVVVKWYEMIHTGLPMCTSAALLGPLRLGPKHRQKFRTGYLPYIRRAAPKAKNLMTIYYEKHWEQDLTEFRQEMNIEVAPALTKKTGRSTKTASHRRKFRTGYLPYIRRAAPKAKNLMTIYYEKHWEQDLEEFRQEMNIEVAPALTKKTGKSTKTAS